MTKSRGGKKLTPLQRRARHVARRVVLGVIVAAAVGALIAADRLGVFGRADVEKYHKASFRVVRVIDGDTMDVDIPDTNGRPTRVRLWGVDTPETKKPETPPQYFGEEATDFTRRESLGKTVRLELEPNGKSRGGYGRLLAWVYLPDGRLLNSMLIEKGYGYADPRYEHHLYDNFRTLQREARKARRGLWKDVTEKDLPYYYKEGKHRL